MTAIDDNLDLSQERSFITLPPEDPYEKIRVIEDRKQYEIKFAKQLLSHLKKVKLKSGFKALSVCFGKDDIDQNILLLTEVFYKNLEKQNILHDLKFDEGQTTMENILTPHPLYATFNSYPEKLIEYLKDYIITEGALHDRTVIIVEPDYGFYKEGIREKCYRITQNGEGKKNFSLISLLANGCALPASKLAGTINVRSNKISDMCKQINEQFKKHCGVFHDVIILQSGGNYCIHSEFLIKESRNP